MISIIANIYHVSGAKLMLLQGKYYYSLCLPEKEVVNSRNKPDPRKSCFSTCTCSHYTVVTMSSQPLGSYLVTRLCQQLPNILSGVSGTHHHFSDERSTVFSMDQFLKSSISPPKFSTFFSVTQALPDSVLCMPCKMFFPLL